MPPEEETVDTGPTGARTGPSNATEGVVDVADIGVRGAVVETVMEGSG